MGRIFNEEIETQQLQKLIKENPVAALVLFPADSVLTTK
jgi:hypothetical protein